MGTTIQILLGGVKISSFTFELWSHDCPLPLIDWLNPVIVYPWNRDYLLLSVEADNMASTSKIRFFGTSGVRTHDLSIVGQARCQLCHRNSCFELIRDYANWLIHLLIHHVWLSIRLNNLIAGHSTNWTKKEKKKDV